MNITLDKRETNLLLACVDFVHEQNAEYNVGKNFNKELDGYNKELMNILCKLTDFKGLLDED